MSRRGTKRGREDTPPEVENVTAGSIEVEECDIEGKFIKLKNTSENVIRFLFNYTFKIVCSNGCLIKIYFSKLLICYN